MEINKQERIKQITQSIIGLPTLPTVITQMIGLIENPGTSAKDVSQLISTDQALTAKILKLANSAFYGFPRGISTCLLYTSPSPRDGLLSRMPSSA